MHKTTRGFAAALLIAVLLLAFPAAAAPREWHPQRIVQMAKRVLDTLIPWLSSRISPPMGEKDEPPPPPPPEEAEPTREAPPAG